MRFRANNLPDIRYQVTTPSTSEIYKLKEDAISSVEILASRAMPTNSNGDHRFVNVGEQNISNFNNRLLDSPSPLASAIRYVKLCFLY